MRLPFPALPILVLCASLAGPARAEDLGALIRADRWADAQAAASGYADPVAAKLVTYYRLLTPRAASAAELAAFMAASPDWPGEATLQRRLAEAIAAEPDDTVVRGFCGQAATWPAATLLRCATALSHAGEPAAAAEAARQAWTTGLTDPLTETAFLQQWSSALTPADQLARFDRLAWTSTSDAQRQLGRLAPADRPAAEARLALRRDDPGAAGLLAALPQSARAQPGLMLEQARWLRRAGQDAQALALWTDAGAAAQAAAPPDRLGAFWAERNLLARRLLTAGDAPGAYRLAAGHGQTEIEPLADAEFLAGFIALRRLNDPQAAQRHFATLASVSKAAITQGRAHYWLGRAIAAAGGDPKPEYAAAAAWTTTYYGQLAAVALGDDPAALTARVAATRDPAWSREHVLAFADREVTRAVVLLVSWGEKRRARAFLLRLEELAPDEADRALAARFALGLGAPDFAVAIARVAGRDGLMLPQAGWPLAADPPDGVEPAATLGLIRQESSFDPQAVSPSGARGLMQLMPATAAQVGRQSGQGTIPVAALTADPALNLRLGTFYLRAMLDQFADAMPLAFAAYNAGPGRVVQWLGDNGDPRAEGSVDMPGRLDMIDWIELIGFNETRNYVQRVIENVVIYRARRGVVLPHPVARWLR